MASTQTDFEKTLEIIEYKILAGILKPRERLVERELAEEYRISIGTVRKILKELVVKHLIHHVSNRGAFVSEPSPEEVEDIFHTRLLLENYAMDRVIRRMTPERLEMIEAHETAFEKNLKEKNLRRILIHNRMFHQSICEGCGNRIVSELIDQLRNRSRIWYDYFRSGRPLMEDSVRDHRRMIECLRAKDTVRLKQINAHHLTSGYRNYKDHLFV